MPSTIQTIFCYGVHLTFEDLKKCPWECEEWDYDFNRWIQKTGFQNQFAFRTFLSLIDGSNEEAEEIAESVIASFSWGAIVNIGDFLLQEIDPNLFSQTEPDPDLELFFATYLSHVRYDPKWLLISTKC